MNSTNIKQCALSMTSRITSLSIYEPRRPSKFLGECEVNVMRTSTKVWTWLEKPKKYGWKYKTVRKFKCRAKGLITEKAGATAHSGEKAGGVLERDVGGKMNSQISQNNKRK